MKLYFSFPNDVVLGLGKAAKPLKVMRKGFIKGMGPYTAVGVMRLVVHPES